MNALVFGARGGAERDRPPVLYDTTSWRYLRALIPRTGASS